MPETNQTETYVEVHDPAILAQARELLDACQSAEEMQEAGRAVDVGVHDGDPPRRQVCCVGICQIHCRQ